MRQLLRELAVVALLLAASPSPSSAQQGSVQVTAAAHWVQGDPTRTAGQPSFEPDLGVSWLRPGTRFGIFQMEIRGTARDEEPRLGRVFVSLRDVTHRGVKYTLEAGDSFFSPAPGEYQLRNLFTPAVNFAGASVKAATKRTQIAIMAGRATAARNFFGTDTEILGQTLAIGRGSYAASDRLEFSARAARIRTRDLKEFRFFVADSDQAGSGVKYVLTPAVHLVGDASLVRFRRRDSAETEVDASVLGGASLLLARGWIQVSASRFSPGELPILTQPLADRRALYGSGEYDLFSRLRVFGGWESFRSNLYEDPAAIGPPAQGQRGFAGIRVPIGSRSSASIRVEDGDRRSRLIGAGLTRVSDTGVVSTEWQSSYRLISGFARFAYRQNVESASLIGTYTQQDGSALAFVNLSRKTQIFGSLTTIRNVTATGSGHTFYQLGGGTQLEFIRRGLWFRAEGLATRNIDLLSERIVPQHTFNVALNGDLARNTTISFLVYADRLWTSNGAADTWVTRSSLRLTRTFPTASHASATAVAATMARHGGTGSVYGVVFSDWNLNGVQDPGESVLENIPIRLANLGNANTARDGEFAFVNVPIGMQQVGIDLSSLPVDFDPPPVPQIQLSLGRGETKRLAFGLVPLGSIAGRVLRDANANENADAGDEAIDGAVVVLNAGARSERVREGQFRFDAVRTGEHTLELLLDSLPDGASVVGQRSVPIAITRENAAPSTTFLVSIQKRPEIRRVFGAEPPASAASTPAPSSTMPAVPKSSPSERRIDPPAVAEQKAAPTRASYTIQIAALRNRARGVELVEALNKAGFDAYLIGPTVSDPIAPYKVRVGTYESRQAAQKDLMILEKKRGEKLWIVAVR
jgi:cell division septation protein DedD